MAVFMRWGIKLDPAQDALDVEVVALDEAGDPAENPPYGAHIINLGNGQYGWRGTVDTQGTAWLIAREVGETVTLDSYGIRNVDRLYISPSTNNVNADNVLGNVFGGILGDPTYITHDTPFVGPGVQVDPADPAWAGVLAAVTVDTAAIAAAVWDRLTTGLTTVGSVGKLLVGKLGLLGSAPTVVQNALSADGGTLTILLGDSYEQDTARRYAGAWTDTADALAGLSIARAFWIVGGNPTGAGEDFTTDLGVSQVDDHTQVALELTKEATAAFRPHLNVRWAVVLVLDGDGDEITWRRGTLVTKARAA